MVRGVIVKINKQKGTSNELTGTVKREDTGEVVSFKSSIAHIPGIGEGDWVSGRVRSGQHYMSGLSFAQSGMRSGVAGRPRRQ